jgi:hybrid cluster-associated redox disulfide protein
MVMKDILAMGSGIAPILQNSGMPCVGCPSAQWETLQQAGLAHGMDGAALDDLVDLINDYLEKA